ncbi:helix-turn-helix domain-containing protein [Xanthobacter autotrophicus]|uniref:helix-turn-helix domain-containing protein n=1 Tax=Xanthobacter TaxID=279 RepID=UPI0024AB27A6|nr:helix-turn-helix domain-containing protein [Xanthobacter autotrophicus]MDI4666732.1 helix-turn-helix domain-containing protein [Xanthobacter autotrophicus]
MSGPQDWHREQIKAAVRMNGTTLSALAKQAGYEPSSFYWALRRPWPAIEQIIAIHLGRRPQDIWPSRYDRRGIPHAGRRQKPSAHTAERHRQKAEAV